MSEVKLKPCPFCGSENIMLDKTKEDILHLAVCRNCVAQVSGFTRDGAIRAWNRRKPMDDIVERLERIKMNYFLTIANTGDANNDFAYENVGNALDNAIEIVKGGVED